MKHLLMLIFSLLLVSSLYGGCNGESGGSSDSMECISDEELANSDCISEDLLNLCEPFFCGATFPPDDNGSGLSADFFFPPEDQDCISLDCNTLECESFGLFSEIEIGLNGRPTGLFDNNPDIDSNPVVEFFCFGSE